LVNIDKQVTTGTPHLSELRDQTSTGKTLGVSDFPLRCVELYGQPATGVKRTALNLALKEALITNGIPIHEGWKLKDIEEDGDIVVAISEDGQKVEGSFLIGCDGIKAASRALLLGRKRVTEGAAKYTGLTQVSPPVHLLNNQPTDLRSIRLQGCRQRHHPSKLVLDCSICTDQAHISLPIL
jgi:salicylate hydroxylase